jgi:hypothetical protein
MPLHSGSTDKSYIAIFNELAEKDDINADAYYEQTTPMVHLHVYAPKYRGIREEGDGA